LSCLLMPEDAAFCRISGDVQSGHIFQGENSCAAKRGKTGQIAAAKSSRKVVKR